MVSYDSSDAQTMCAPIDVSGIRSDSLRQYNQMTDHHSNLSDGRQSLLAHSPLTAVRIAASDSIGCWHTEQMKLFLMTPVGLAKQPTPDRSCVPQAETDQKKNITAPLVLTLLAISVVVPMLQYWGYTSEVRPVVSCCMHSHGSV